MKYFQILIPTFTIIASCAQLQIDKSVNNNSSEISSEKILKHIKYLSSDELEGRYPGSKGSKLAISYIEKKFNEYKLEPVNSNGYQQYFDFIDKSGDSISIPNVVGIIKGSDRNKNDELIVLGAHFDHLGYGGAHSGSLMINSNEIHNGADDNASGVAGIIELARKLSNHQNKLRRSIIIVAFNAEEQGIFGSKFFVNDSFFNTKKMIMMVNLDMIGRLNKLSLNISGTGTSPVFNSLLDNIASKHNLNIIKNPNGLGPSDHASFYANDIPVLFFFTGGHSDYHKPSDDWNKINVEGEKKILNMIFDIIKSIDQLDNRPTFTESGPKTQSPQQNLKVTFGFMPSYSPLGKGLGVDGVRKDGPAGKAGLLKGDIIIEINGIMVKDIYGYMDILSKLNSGENSKIIILRDGIESVLIINH